MVVSPPPVVVVVVVVIDIGGVGNGDFGVGCGGDGYGVDSISGAQRLPNKSHHPQ